MRQLVAVIILLFVTHGASALSVTLVPLQSTHVVVGQSVTFDVVFDWSSDPDLVVLGGGFDIVFDANALAFAGLTLDFIGNPKFSREPI